jgi:NAD(P)-dependent dehydrogenase (short-subunit alcohol dehydrogenase family)
MDCSGKVALVTGAGDGIGRACAIALAANGAFVIATDIDSASAAKTAEMIGSDKARADKLDVTIEDEWQRIFADIAAQEGAIDIMVNNAGIAVGVPFVEMSLADWQRQNAVNLDGVFLGSKYAVLSMAAKGTGSIINVSSVAGLVGAPGLAGYCATKGGVRLFTKAAAVELASGGLNIRVNSVHPGIIDTPIWGKDISGLLAVAPEMSLLGSNRLNVDEMSEKTVPGGKAGKPEDIANAVVFLASDASSYMTGSEVVIDHGLTAS